MRSLCSSTFASFCSFSKTAFLHTPFINWQLQTIKNLRNDHTIKQLNNSGSGIPKENIPFVQSSLTKTMQCSGAMVKSTMLHPTETKWSGR